MDDVSGEALDVDTLDAIEAEVADVERALVRLEDGSYGTCEVCGVRLAPAVLAERPAARLCPVHLDIVSR